LGGEYSLSPAIDLRFGAFRSSTPITPSKRSPAFPFSDKLGFSLGLGYPTGRFNLDAAYVYTAHSEIEDINGGLIRWGDDSQKYLSRNAGCFIVNSGIRF